MTSETPQESDQMPEEAPAGQVADDDPGDEGSRGADRDSNDASRGRNDDEPATGNPENAGGG